MPNTLTHSPADVIRYMLIDLALGAEPAENATWPIYAAGEPPAPDDCITVYDTTGVVKGRQMIDGKQLLYRAFQVRIRSTTHNVGWSKADSIRVRMAEEVYDKAVHVGSESYLVHAVSNISDVHALGKDVTNSSKRSLFTINAIAAIKQLA